MMNLPKRIHGFLFHLGLIEDPVLEITPPSPGESWQRAWDDLRHAHEVFNYANPEYIDAAILNLKTCEERCQGFGNTRNDLI